MLKPASFLLLTMAIWGSQPVIIRLALDFYSSEFAAFIRCASAALTFGAVAIASKRRVERRRAPPFSLPLKLWLVFGGASLGLANILWNLSMSYTTVSAASVLQLSSIPVLALYGLFVLSEPRDARRAAGTFLALVGAILVTWNGEDLSALLSSRHFQGNLLALGSGALWAICAIGQKLAVAGRSSIVVVAPMFIISALACAIPGLCSPAVTSQFNLLMLAALLVTGALGLGLGNLLFAESMRTLPASLGAAALAVSPLVTVVTATWVLHEPVSLYLLVGAPLTCAGVTLAVRRETSAALTRGMRASGSRNTNERKGESR